MAYIEQLTEILDRYRADIDTLEKNKKPTDGLLGFGKKPGDDACHQILDQQVGALLAQLAEDVGSAEADQVINRIFDLGVDESWPSYAHWALIALQRHTLPLIPRLSAQEAADLSAAFDRLYPRRMRMPIQVQIAKAFKR